ncbi:MAG TPA: CocE/NonD family hydrolase [Solirubrobacteraceae bacterium]
MRILGLLCAVALVLVLPATASAAKVTKDERVTMSDGVALQATVSGEGPLARRPVIVEFSPYGRNTATLDVGPAYNHLLVQIRGTGDSIGAFDALGPRTQADVVELLRWACAQPWSDGRLGINGFSASAITIYNSLHQTLPCVKTAVLKSGTHELYRDLITPGGVSNLVPAFGVMALIGAPALVQGADRLDDPVSGAQLAAGLVKAGLDGLLHSSLDGWWRERGFRGDVNHLPILMVNGFFDVESRGAFEGYRALRGDGAHLYVIGAHDGAPVGTDAGVGEMRTWFDHHLRGEANGVQDHPRAQLWLSDGDREDMLAGTYVRYDAADWPAPGTRWLPLALDAARSGTARSLNDGTLTVDAPAAGATQSYPALPSLVFNSDSPNTAIIGGFGFNALATALPPLTDMSLAETLGLSYTTKPLDRDVLLAGPASLELPLSTSVGTTAIWAVISDVSPDGTPHPLMAGRLNTDFPGVDAARSLKDPVTGDIVQPYGRYDEPQPAKPGEERRYSVELWPIGNRFKKGHRLRLHVVGASLASKPDVPGINTVRVGGPDPARLLLPVLPGSDLSAALGGPPMATARACTSRRRIALTPRRVPRGARVTRLRVTVNGRRAKATRRGRRVLLDLRGRPAGDVRVRIAVRYRLRGRSRQVTERRSYRLCAAAFH